MFRIAVAFVFIAAGPLAAVSLQAGVVVPGELLVGQNNNNQLLVAVDPATGIKTPASGGFPMGGPAAIAIDSHGNVLMVDGSARLFEANGQTGAISLLATGVNSGIDFDGIAIGADGQIYVSVGNALAVGEMPSVIAFDPTTLVNHTVTSHGFFNQFGPQSLAIGPNGDLFVGTGYAVGAAPPGVGAIIEINPTTGSQSIFSLGGYLGVPDGLTFDEAGNLIVSDDKGAIVRINSAGSQTLVSQGGLLNASQGIAVGGDGKYYVANVLGHNLLRIDPVTGAQSVVTSFGAFEDRAVFYVPASAVPEPSTLSICGTTMLLGLIASRFKKRRGRSSGSWTLGKG